MNVYEIDIPGKGKFRVESQGEMTEAQAYRAAAGQADMLRMADPTSGMSTLEKGRAGFGKAFADLGRGAKQILGLKTDAEESRRLDKPLMETGAGTVGNIAGNVAAAVPSFFIPGVNTYTGAGLVGAGLGALQPTVEGESRAMNAAVGAGGGVVGQGLGNVVGRAIRPVQSQLPPAEQLLAQQALRRNIPLTAGQATGSRPLQITESVMENLPFTAGPQLALKEAQSKAFTREALSKAGIAGDEATAPVLGSQKSNLGQQFEDIAGRNVIDFNQGSVLNDLSKVASEGARRLSNPEPLKNTIDDILADAANGVMEGTKYQGWRETLRRLASGNGTEAHYFGEVKKSLDKAFNAQVSSADSQAWKQTSREYGNLKTILDAMGGAGAGTKTGHIPPAQLEGALTRSMGREGKALGRGDLNELVGIGRKFVSEQIPNSGTAQRQLVQSLVTGGGGSLLGAGGAAATGNDPLKGAAIGAGVTAGGLLTPRAVQMLMNSPGGQKYLTRGLLDITPKEAKAINALARSGGAAGLLGYTPQQ